MKSMIKVKVEENDNHKIIQLFKDVTEQLLIKNDGYKGTLKSYEYIELIESVKAGDYIEVVGELVAFDYTQRKIELEARRVITHSDEENNKPGEYLVKPVVICRARAVCEVPVNNPRG
ncbi:MAG: hypothetical protein ACRDA3_07905 [Peptostreptococcaceae bacterium]